MTEEKDAAFYDAIREEVAESEKPTPGINERFGFSKESEEPENEKTGWDRLQKNQANDKENL